MMANTTGEKELKTDWPIEEGLTARTQKQTGRQMNLIAELSLLTQDDLIGIEG